MVKLVGRMQRDQRGITGLETAIILIAFVVVASVFAYTVLSAGIFSAQKGSEAIHAGLQAAKSSMELVGSVVAKDTDSDDDVDEFVFTVANAIAGEPIDLIETVDADSDGVLSDEATKLHSLIATYIDKNQRVEDLAWTSTPIGRGDGDDLLEQGEKFEIVVTLTAISPVLDEYDIFSL